jgi:two-component system cell cycle sensor histidine kinase/response regulator CckA
MELADAAGDAINGVFANGTIGYWSPGAERLYGYSAAEALGRPATLIVPPEHHPSLGALIASVAAGQRVVAARVERMAKGGRRFPVELTIVPLTDETGLFLGGFALAREISDRLNIEARLRESRAFLEEAQALAHIGSWEAWLDGSGRSEWSNESYRIFGVEVGAPVSAATFYEAVHVDDRARHAEVSAAGMKASGSFALEHRIVRPLGEVRWVRSEARLSKDGAGHPILLGTVQDVTERRTLEGQLVRAQRMEAVGQLAGGVAHDFNNLLTPILSYASILLDDLSPDDPMRVELDEIRKAGERAAGLTSQLLAFSRQQVIERRIVDVNALVADLERMLLRVLGEHLELRTHLAPDLHHVLADPGQIEQIIVNLAVNARDAMPSGGKLVIETANVSLDEAFTSKHHGMQPGRYAMLAVTDTGSGMDATTLSRIFEPFFTTKERGRGTGLGLSTVYGIVKQSGGAVWVYSEVGHGTTFKVYLPAHAGEAAIAAAEVAPSSAAMRDETILLVEDEEIVRDVAHRILRRRGYRVLVARNGAEAISLAQAEEGPIHLLLTDVVMPGMSGRDAADRITSRRPDLKVLYMSGYTDNTVFAQGVHVESVSFLQKPFTPDSLAAKVHTVLQQPAAARKP